MAGGRRKTAPSPSKTGGESKVGKVEVEEDAIIIVDESSPESEVQKLRGRWELASVLNFLSVFETVIGYDLKLTAEEIEMGLIEPDSSIAQLHIILLKGIPPVSKKLNEPGAWVTFLCKKLAMWWPWVSEGEIPLTAAKGEEVSRYKELDPTCRLQILKALCEIRADQNDAVSYISGAVKKGTQISCFRKDKIGGDVNGNSYWYDGNTIIGYRLYREVDRTSKKAKLKGKACLNPPSNSSFQWETLATNFEEFCEVVDELSSSKFSDDVVLGKAIKKDVIPIVEKFQKKKERSLKRKQRQEMLLQNGFRNAYGAGITRACRSRRAISYTFDEYDRAIDEAIELNKKRKSVKEQRCENRKIASSGGSEASTSSKDGDGKRDESEASETESGKLKEAPDDDDKNGGIDNGINCDDGEMDDDSDDDIYDDEKDDDDGDGRGSSNFEEEEKNPSEKNHPIFVAGKPLGTRWSKRFNGGPSHPVETRNLGTKNRLRQRPLRNSAIDSVAVDSEDDKSSEHGNMSVVADLEEASDN